MGMKFWWFYIKRGFWSFVGRVETDEQEKLGGLEDPGSIWTMLLFCRWVDPNVICGDLAKWALKINYRVFMQETYILVKRAFQIARILVSWDMSSYIYKGWTGNYVFSAHWRLVDPVNEMMRMIVRWRIE